MRTAARVDTDLSSEVFTRKIQDQGRLEFGRLQ